MVKLLQYFSTTCALVDDDVVGNNPANPVEVAERLEKVARHNIPACTTCKGDVEEPFTAGPGCRNT